MIPEDQHLAILFYVVASVAGVYGAVLVWLIRRVLKLEKDNNSIAKELAVLQKGQDDLKDSWLRAEKRNDNDHARILAKLDSLPKVIRNGGG